MQNNDLKPFAVGNQQVAQAWADGRYAHNWNNTFRSDGRSLWSHALRIGITQPDGTKVAFYARAPENFVSGSTSAHVGYAMKHAQNAYGNRTQFDALASAADQDQEYKRRYAAEAEAARLTRLTDPSENQE